jgi:hypothetical protein
MRPEIPQRIKEIHARICVLEKEIFALEKRETAERENISNFKLRTQKLDSLAERSLSGGDNEYAKFKTSIKKLNEQLGCSEEILEKMRQVRKPLVSELQTHRHNLTLLLSNWGWEYVRAVEAEKRFLIEAVMAAVEECLRDIEKQCVEFGIMFVPAKHLILFGLPETYVRDYRLKKAQLAAANTPVIESTHTPTEAPVPVATVQAPLVEPDEPPDSIEPARPGPDAEHEPVETDELSPETPDAPPTPAVPLPETTIWGTDEDILQADEGR